MKKLMMMAVILLAGVGSVMAQSDYKRGIFNHVGLNVGAGTEGISVGVAAPVTNFLEVEAGVNIMPSFKLSGDLDVDYDSSSLPQVSGVSYPNPATIHVDGDFSRTTFNVKANLVSIRWWQQVLYRCWFVYWWREDSRGYRFLRRTS